MVTNLGKGKLWIQTSCRPGEGWAQPGYFYPRHATWIVPPSLNCFTGPMRDTCF